MARPKERTDARRSELTRLGQIPSHGVVRHGWCGELGMSPGWLWPVSGGRNGGRRESSDGLGSDSMARIGLSLGVACPVLGNHEGRRGDEMGGVETTSASRSGRFAV